MFEKPKNIDTTFRQIRLFTLIIVIASFLFAGYTLFQNQQLTNSLQQKVYILANGKVLEALLTNRRENLEVEAKDHISTFHRHFFTLDPDEKVIKSKTAKALYLADMSPKRQFDNLRESNYYFNIIVGINNQETQTDSILLELMKKNGGRHLSLKVKNKHLMQAKTLDYCLIHPSNSKIKTTLSLTT